MAVRRIVHLQPFRASDVLSGNLCGWIPRSRPASTRPLSPQSVLSLFCSSRILLPSCEFFAVQGLPGYQPSAAKPIPPPLHVFKTYPGYFTSFSVLAVPCKHRNRPYGHSPRRCQRQRFFSEYAPICLREIAAASWRGKKNLHAKKEQCVFPGFVFSDVSVVDIRGYRIR